MNIKHQNINKQHKYEENLHQEPFIEHFYCFGHK